MALSPDCKLFASGSYDSKVRLWDLHSLTEILVLKGHLHYVNALAFSPDSKILASGSNDCNIILWDLQRKP
jgi:WD40 repeat protein